MSGNTGIIKIALQMDEKGSIKVLNTIGNESEKTGKKGKESFDKMDKGARKFSEGAKQASSSLVKIGAGIAGLYVIRRGISALSNQMMQWTELSNVQIEAETDLQAVLNATGHAAGYNLGQLKAMASGMQDLTTIGDEVTLSGMAILGTFKQIQGEAFERSTMAALDMSKVMKQDVKSSMTMIGKAVNDPLKGLSALSRVGVTFTDEQKEMIQILQETGDMMGAQNIILAELESQFGGAAEAAALTFAGGMTQAGNALGDVKEELGFVITKNQFFIELSHVATDEFKIWGTHISQNRDYLMQLSKNGVLTFVDSMNLALETMRFFHNGWLGIKLVGNAAVHGLAVAMDELNPMMRKLMTPLDAIFEGLVKIGVMDVNPFDSLEAGLETFRLSSGDVTADVMADIAKTNARYDSVKGTIQGWKEKIKEIPVTQVAANDQTEKSTNAHLIKMAEMQDKYKDKVIANQNEIAESVSAVAVDKHFADISRNMNGVDKLIEGYASKRVSLTERMYADLTFESEEYYQYRKDQIQAEYEELKAYTGDEVNSYRWYKDQLNELDEDHAEWKKEQTEADQKAHEDAMLKNMDATDQFFYGMKKGLDDSNDDLEDWRKKGTRTVRSFSQDGRDAMSDILFDGMRGDMDDLSSYFDTALSGIARKFTDVATDMAWDWGTDALGMLTGWWDTGVWKVKKDHVGVIHEGEMIIPKGEADVIRNRAEQGLTAGDLADGWQNRDMSAFMAGFKSMMALHTAKGLQLLQADKISAGDFITGLGKSTLYSTVVGGVPTYFNDQMGMRSSNWGRGGQTFGRKLGGFFGGPLGAMVGGILGGPVGMGLGDLLDARSSETVRDHIEDRVGFFGGQRVYSQFQKAHGDPRTIDEFYDPSTYDRDYGSSSSSNPTGNTTFDSYGINDSGVAWGFSDGGAIDRVMMPLVPQSEDGWAPVRLKEGIVSEKGMETLDQINAGSFSLDLGALVAEIRMLRAELRTANFQNIKANKKTARFAELSYTRDEVAA